MASEHEKGIVEVAVFKRFAQVAGLKVSSVEKKMPKGGVPDLRCRIDGEVVYFELAEACSEEIAKATASTDSDAMLSRAKDYTAATFQKKLEKKYRVSEPVELLIYNAGRSALPDQAIVDSIRELAEAEKGPFRRIWYFGEHVLEI